MKNIKNKKFLMGSLLALMLIFVAGIFAFGGTTLSAYAHEDETIREGYTVDDIRDILKENNSFNSSSEWLTVYNEDGSMENIEVPCDNIEEQNSGFMTYANFDMHEIVHSGRPNNQSIVITILGDGFTSTQQAAFINKATTTAEYLIGLYPFVLFKDYFNIYAVEVHSNETGVSRDSSTYNNDTVDNYFGSTFWHDGSTERLLYITRASRVPSLVQSNTAMTVILANSTRYGGGGGTYAVSSINSNANEIMVHELGHSFGTLKDEYWWAAGAAEAPNMTKISSTSTVKWSSWIGYKNVGVYSHASSGTGAIWYKPHQSCRMQALGNSFCPVCSATLIGKMEAKTGALFNTTNLSVNSIRIDKLNLNVSGSFEMPERINGRIVTEIGSSAFANSGMSQITIPSSVNSIGSNAFPQGVHVILAEGRTTIQAGLFQNQTQISKISIPSSVTTLGLNAFHVNTRVDWQGKYSFRGSEFWGILGGQTTFAIPEIIAGRTITSIGNSAFANQNQLTQISIPSSVTNIKQNAFLNSGIWNNTANNSIVYAGNWAVGFRGVLNSSISLNSNTRGISDYAFAYQTGIMGVNLPNSLTIIGSHAFHDCTNLSNINLSGNLTIIGDHAFRRCIKLTAIALPDNLISIGNLAFEHCIDLKSITIPLSVTTIGYEAFSGCSNLTIYAKTVTKPNGWSATWNLSNRPVVWAHNGLMWQVVSNGQLVAGRPTRVSLDFWITTASSYGDDSSTDLYRVALEFTNSITINGGTLGLIQATVSNNGYITLSWTNYYDSSYSAYLDSWGITSGTYIEQYF